MWKFVLLLLGVIWTPGPAEAATPACPTAGGRTCVFPFVTSAGESVSKCQAYNGRSYCATSLKSTGKYATWDYCVDIKCPVIGKSDNNESCPTVKGKSCIFPFKTKGGESVSVCQPYNNQYFCATSLKSDGRYSGWDYCDATKCPNKGMVQATASCPTVKGKSCIFPFKTKGGESVSVCQPYNNKHFCATSLKSDGRYSSWGYCTSECPKHGEAAGIKMAGLVLSPTSCPSVKGDKCIFPFKKGSTTYNVCQPYKNKYYCATSLKSDGTYRTWDYCDTNTCPNPGTCSPGGDGGCNYPFRQGGSFSVCAKTSSHLFWCTAGDSSGSGSGSSSQCPKPTPAKQCPKPEECPVTPKPTGTCKCGIKKTSRIIGGNESGVNEYPWIAIFAAADGTNQGGCASTLIANNWAVTASHCLVNADGPLQTTSSMSVVLGIHDRTVTTDTLRKVVPVAEIITHPNYNPANSQNDIALLKLGESVDLAAYSPACLPAQGADFAGKNGWVYGWGVTQEGGADLAEKLQELEVPIVSDATCITAMEPQGVTITADMLCAGGVEGKDGCQGDSGGPFTVDVDGKHTLVGDVSFGIGCARAGLYGVYAETAQFRTWIDETIAAKGGATFCS